MVSLHLRAYANGGQARSWEPEGVGEEPGHAKLQRLHEERAREQAEAKAKAEELKLENERKAWKVEEHKACGQGEEWKRELLQMEKRREALDGGGFTVGPFEQRHEKTYILLHTDFVAKRSEVKQCNPFPTLPVVVDRNTNKQDGRGNLEPS